VREIAGRGAEIGNGAGALNADELPICARDGQDESCAQQGKAFWQRCVRRSAGGGHYAEENTDALKADYFARQGCAKGKAFFSEEKNQKTFGLPPPPTWPAMAGIFPWAPTQKSFGSFLQKRTPSLVSL
jgi:hypothetical protein